MALRLKDKLAGKSKPDKQRQAQIFHYPNIFFLYANNDLTTL